MYLVFAPFCGSGGTIKKTALPQLAPRSASTVDKRRRDVLDRLHHFGNGQRILRGKDRMPRRGGIGKKHPGRREEWMNRSRPCHAVILSGAKNPALAFSADQQQGVPARWDDTPLEYSTAGGMTGQAADLL